MTILGLEIGWQNLAAGGALSTVFIIGVWLGSKWTQPREKIDWPTPYPRQATKPGGKPVVDKD